MEKITLNVACVLLISSSFPVVARILGMPLILLLSYLSPNSYRRNYKFRFARRLQQYHLLE